MKYLIILLMLVSCKEKEIKTDFTITSSGTTVTTDSVLMIDTASGYIVALPSEIISQGTITDTMPSGIGGITSITIDTSTVYFNIYVEDGGWLDKNGWTITDTMKLINGMADMLHNYAERQLKKDQKETNGWYQPEVNKNIIKTNL